jgi:hypothetical protein
VTCRVAFGAINGNSVAWCLLFRSSVVDSVPRDGPGKRRN